MSNHPNRDDRAQLDLVEQHAGDDFVRELLSWALHRVMEAEVGEITGAGKGERSSEERENLCNGYRRRDWDTRVGTIPLNIPKLREGGYMPSFIEPRRTSERAFAAKGWGCSIISTSANSRRNHCGNRPKMPSLALRELATCGVFATHGRNFAWLVT